MPVPLTRSSFGFADLLWVGRPCTRVRVEGASTMPRVREVMTFDPATASPSMSVVEEAGGCWLSTSWTACWP
jgi:hypothetical protein